MEQIASTPLASSGVMAVAVALLVGALLAGSAVLAALRRASRRGSAVVGGPSLPASTACGPSRPGSAVRRRTLPGSARNSTPTPRRRRAPGCALAVGLAGTIAIALPTAGVLGVGALAANRTGGYVETVGELLGIPSGAAQGAAAQGAAAPAPNAGAAGQKGSGAAVGGLAGSVGGAGGLRVVEPLASRNTLEAVPATAWRAGFTRTSDGALYDPQPARQLPAAA